MMDRETYEKIVRDIVNNSLELSKAKGHDYADEDVLSNFKRVAKIAQLYRIDFSSPYQYALFMVLMKLDRMQNLLTQNKKPKNESLDDTDKDSFNYLMLSIALRKEQENGTEDK